MMNLNEDQKPSTEELETYLKQTLSESDSSENNQHHVAAAASDKDNWTDEMCYEPENVTQGSTSHGDVSCRLGGETSTQHSHQGVSDYVTIIALKGSGKGYVIEGFVFIRDRCRNGNIYLKCRNRSCKARAIISRLNYVSLAGSGHEQTCTPVGNIITYQCLGQIIPTMPTELSQKAHDNSPSATEEELQNFPEAVVEHFESENLQVSSFHPNDLPSHANVNRNYDDGTEVACYSNNAEDISKESSFFSSLAFSSLNASAPSRLHHTSTPIHQSRTTKKRTKRPHEDATAAGSSRPYPIGINPTTSLIENGTTETSHAIEMPPSKKPCTLDFLLPRRVLHENSQEILAIFRVFRDIRNKTTRLRMHQNFPPLKNDLILRAARGEKTERVPVWVMRQAGRYLPEFQAVRKEHDFFEICQTPELACEITLQPISRFDLDAAIIFSDILVIPQVLGIHVEMITGKGLVFDNTLSSPEDLARLQSDVDVTEALSYVFDAITLTRRRLEGKVPLIGFSGAPWTLMGYCIEGTGNSMTLSKAKKWLYAYPEQSHTFLQLLTDKIVDYLVGQVLAGAQLLQVFDSNVGVLGHDLFMTFALPYLKQIVTKVKSTLRETNFEPVPMIVFAKGAHYALEELSKMGYDVISLDWTIQPEVARAQASPTVCLQGNLDPCAMYSTRDNIEGLVGKMLNSFGTQRYIANLGHGVYPDFDPEHVRTFIDTIHAQSEAINKRKPPGKP